MGTAILFLFSRKAKENLTENGFGDRELKGVS